MLENIRYRLKTIKNCDKDKIIKQHSKLTFSGFQTSYTSHSSYTFIQNETVMDKPIYVGFTFLELSQFYMYEIIYDKLQPYFVLENIQ